MSCSNSTVARFPELSPTAKQEVTAWIATTLTICVVGVLNNFLLIRVIWTAKLQRSGVSFLLFHFVVVNLLMCLVTVPAAIFLVIFKRDGWSIPCNVCHYITTLNVINMTVVNWADVGLALNRFVALYFPFRYKAWATPRVNFAIIACSWVISTAIAMPFGVAAGGQGVTQSAIGLCSLDPRGYLGSFLVVSSSYVPYCISGAGAVLISWTCLSFLRLHVAVGLQNTAGGSRRRMVQRRLNMAKMLLFTFLWTGFCVIPAYVVNRGRFPQFFGPAAISVFWIRTSTACQFAFTPCILLLSNPDYQQRAKAIISGHPVAALDADATFRSARTKRKVPDSIPEENGQN
ncbi:hypothetical protein BV898_14248 [Hypsibius exemplaris]|uniref:G-protein coupled receptors family 1 profile domain-containing protein n=1 Tax=Hypsibius exemplaris TaxID=2072580 RepID=A0A1W0W8H2_HYPEX|nr:hypothetical protein BV898_14248 [Hypsibius exemplaris]